MKKKQRLTKRGYFKKYRERIFRNNKVVLSTKRRLLYAKEELSKNKIPLEDVGIVVDSYDPFMSVSYTSMSKNIMHTYIGYSKRMPNDIPNDKIGIQVAIGSLIKRLKNG